MRNRVLVRPRSLQQSLRRRYYEPPSRPIHLLNELLLVGQQEFPLGTLHLDHDPGGQLVDRRNQAERRVVGQPDRETVQLVEVDLVFRQRSQLVGRHAQEVSPERLQRVATLQSRELHQPFPVIAPAPLHREGAGYRISLEVHHPDLTPRSEDRFRVVGQGKERAVALQAVGLSQAAHHYMAGAPSHYALVVWNTPACLSRDWTVSDGVAPLAIHCRAFSASTFTLSAGVAPLGL